MSAEIVTVPAANPDPLFVMVTELIFPPDCVIAPTTAEVPLDPAPNEPGGIVIMSPTAYPLPPDTVAVPVAPPAATVTDKVPPLPIPFVVNVTGVYVAAVPLVSPTSAGFPETVPVPTTVILAVAGSPPVAGRSAKRPRPGPRRPWRPRG